MRRTLLAMAGCMAAVLAGCGSSSQTPTVPASAGSTTGSTTGRGALNHTGSVGTMGAPGSGSLSAKDPTVIPRIDSQLVSFYTSKGFTGVTAVCNGTSPTTASCRVTGTNSGGQASSAVLTITLAPTTGQLTVTHVAP